MPQKAFRRLKIPTSYINIICSLFMNRHNRVFTAVGTTDPYDVLIGIDQGEVISPLLWCIYYDPLLCEIEQRKLGYTISHSYKPNLYLDQTVTIDHTIAALDYMDDTQWLTDSQSKLETILGIADDFYDLNNIKVN